MTSAQTLSGNPLGGLLSLETAVLRAFCLAINTNQAATARHIGAGLDRSSFYFPVTRSVFSALSELESSEALITASSLEEKLQSEAVDVPGDFYLEDLFMGEPPEPEALEEWMATLRGRRVGTPRPDARRAESTAGLAQTHPSVGSPRPDPVAELDEVVGSSAMALLAEHSNVAPFPSGKASRPVPDVVESVEVDASTRSTGLIVPKSRSAMGSTSRVHLAPESVGWPGYLAALSDRQGDWLKTGFSALDECFGGLGPGVAHVLGGELEATQDFLKQLVDQIAAGSSSRCLYVSFERTTAELRLKSLARLTQEPAADISGGRFDRLSPRWKRVVKTAQASMEWLSRVYVADLSDPSERETGLTINRLAELCAEVRSSDEPTLDLVVIDNVHRIVPTESGQTFSELRSLASTLGIALVVSQNRGPHSDVLDDELSLVFEAAARTSERILRCSGHGESVRVRFHYESRTHRFVP